MRSKIHVYKVQDGDWIAACTSKQALIEQVSQSGAKEFLLNQARKLSDSELNTNCVQDEEFGDTEPVSFRFALNRLIASGAKFPLVLATVE